MSQQNIDLVQSGYAAFRARRHPRVPVSARCRRRVDTPGASDVPTAGTRRPAQVGAFFRVLSSLVDFEHFEPQAFIADGDPRGGARGVTQHGQRRVRPVIRRVVVSRLLIRDGKVAKFYEYLDTAAFAASSRRQPHARNGSEPG